MFDLTSPETVPSTGIHTEANVSSFTESEEATQCPALGGSSFIIPPSDLHEFAALPDSARQKVRRTLHALQAIHRASKSRSSSIAEAARIQSRRMTGLRGFSPVRLEAKYFLFLKTGGDWHCLLDRAIAGVQYWDATSRCRSLPAAFIQFWKKLCEENQRKCSPAHRELLRIWRTHQDSMGRIHKAIPGYAEWPECGLCGSHPRGWSLENLMRHAPEDFELIAARKGRWDASSRCRQVFKTRADLAVGQFILFDDQEYDLKINFPNSSRAMRPLGLNALDLYSACCFAYGFKPTLLNEDATKQKLKEIDMMWFVVHVLTQFGYNPQVGTHFVVEHGTAAIRPDFEERILFCTDRKVAVDRSGIHGNPAFAALYEGASKGNPRFKAPLESFFNLVRNDMAMLPGQTGRNRDNSPDELYGRDLENNRLLKAAALIGPDRAALLKLPFWNWTQFQQFAIEMYQRINRRTEHSLEGWAELTASEWRLQMGTAQDWFPVEHFLSLSSEQQSALKPIIQSRVRRLSPHEVFQSGSSKLRKVPNSLLPDLLGSQFSEVRTVRDGYIEIKDQELSADPLPYLAHSPAASVRNGDQYRCYLNPFNPSTLVIATVKENKFVAELPLQDTVSWADTDAIKRQLGAAQHELADRLQPLGIRHAQRARARAKDTQHNATVLSGRPVTMQEKDRAAQIKENVTNFGAEAAEDILGRPPEIIPATEPSLPTEPINTEDAINDIL